MTRSGLAGGLAGSDAAKSSACTSGSALPRTADDAGAPVDDGTPWADHAGLLAIVEAVSEAIAVIDEHGVIRLVNRAWREFSIANGTVAGQPARRTGVGTDYLQVCAQAAACGSEGAQEVMEGISAVLNARSPGFSHSYPCDTPDRRRWFSLRVTPLSSGRGGAVLAHIDVTDVKLAEEEARAVQGRMEALTAAVPGVIYEFQRTAVGDWRFLYVSEGINELFEVTPEVALADHASLSDCIVAEDRASHLAAVELSARELTPWTHEHRIRTRSGKLKWVRGQALPQRQADGSVTWQGILIDVTRLKQTEQALLESEQRWMFALEGAGDGVWDWNLQTGQAHFSRRWKLMFGYDDADIGNESTEWSSRVHPEDMPSVMDALQAHLEGRTASVVVEFRMRRKAGDWGWTQGRGMLVSRDAAGQPLRLVGTNTDITDRKAMEERLHQLAFHDALTLLPNRRLLLDHLALALASCRRTGRRAALVFLDLDNFKFLNDKAGHAVGDLLLVEVAHRLKCCVRETDTVARFGGDEFVVLIGELDGDMPGAADQAGAIARKMSLALAVPYLLAAPHEVGTDARVEHHCTVSIGVALLGTGTWTVDSALGIADQAMYQAKQSGRNSICMVEAATNVDGRAEPVPGWSGQDWSASDGS